jgi:hypothetical protein
MHIGLRRNAMTRSLKTNPTAPIPQVGYSYKWHSTWVPSTILGCGTIWLQMDMACRQRGWKVQPEGGKTGLGKVAPKCVSGTPSVGSGVSTLVGTSQASNGIRLMSAMSLASCIGLGRRSPLGAMSITDQAGSCDAICARLFCFGRQAIPMQQWRE